VNQCEKRFKILTYGSEMAKHVFQLILIQFLLISTESKMFQQTNQIILAY
jgi:hypothetical protein